MRELEALGSTCRKWKRVCLYMAVLLFGYAFGAETNAAPEAEGSPSVTLVAVGDILLDRGLATKIALNGPEYPFEHVAAVLSKADIAFGNLECPIARHAGRVPKMYCFKARPETIDCLIASGLDVVSLANNHALDCGRPGLVETMENLDNACFYRCGAGTTREEAFAPAVIPVKGLHIAFLGFTDLYPESTFDRADKPSLAFASEENVRTAVSAAKQKADAVVVSFHWGVEYQHYPGDAQVKLARAAVEAGACLVLGHHPHVLGGFAVPATHALVAYSLGNFVFDQFGGGKVETIVLRCVISREGVVRAEVLPMRLVGFRPTWISPPESKALIGKIAEWGDGGPSISNEGYIFPLTVTEADEKNGIEMMGVRSSE